MTDEIQLFEFINSQDFFNNRKDRKKRITKLNIYNMLRRTLSMFKYDKLPETITHRTLELTLQTRGHIGWIKLDNKLYTTYGQLGGIPNYNYMPSQYIIANPYLKLDKQTFEIYGDNKDVVVMANDTLYQGILGILSFHSELLTEIQLTKRRVLINSRLPTLYTAPDNNAKADIDDLFKDIEEGEFGSILAKNILKDINAIDVSQSQAKNLITQILEMEQYQKASLFNDIGLQMNYNMKRETITSSEAQLGESALLPLPDDMYEQRKKAIKEVNELFDEHITVEFNSAWADLRKSIQVEMQIQENEINQPNEKPVQSTVQENNEDKNEENNEGNEEIT